MVFNPFGPRDDPIAQIVRERAAAAERKRLVAAERREAQRQARAEARFRALPASERARRRVQSADSEVVRRGFRGARRAGRRVGSALRRADLSRLPQSRTALTRPSVGRGGLVSRLRGR